MTSSRSYGAVDLNALRRWTANEDLWAEHHAEIDAAVPTLIEELFRLTILITRFAGGAHVNQLSIDLAFANRVAEVARRITKEPWENVWPELEAALAARDKYKGK